MCLNNHKNSFFLLFQKNDQGDCSVDPGLVSITENLAFLVHDLQMLSYTSQEHSPTFLKPKQQTLSKRLKGVITDPSTLIRR